MKLCAVGVVQMVRYEVWLDRGSGMGRGGGM